MSTSAPSDPTTTPASTSRGMSTLPAVPTNTKIASSVPSPVIRATETATAARTRTRTSAPTVPSSAATLFWLNPWTTNTATTSTPIAPTRVAVIERTVQLHRQALELRTIVIAYGDHPHDVPLDDLDPDARVGIAARRDRRDGYGEDDATQHLSGPATSHRPSFGARHRRSRRRPGCSRRCRRPFPHRRACPTAP